MAASLLDAIPDLDPAHARQLDDRIDARVRALLAEPPAKQRKLAIVASKGSLDWAYPPLMMANNAAKKGWEVGIFFTFYGLNVIHRDKGKGLQISPVGNPAMPMPTPTLLGVIPGMTPLATWMMRRQFKQRGVPTIEDLLDQAVANGVKLFPCGFTIDVFGYRSGDFIDGAQPRLGSADFLEYAADADVALFV
ncbi:MAG TPA: DsrE/DsrF/DrsH-like family protein [Thermomicrobiales bacterium]|jgi:peroxiredoxin family protein